jgi:hypothetical protein
MSRRVWARAEQYGLIGGERAGRGQQVVFA